MVCAVNIRVDGRHERIVNPFMTVRDMQHVYYKI